MSGIAAAAGSAHHKPAVARAPMTVAPSSHGLRRPPASTIAPRGGLSRPTRTALPVIAQPHKAVPSTSSPTSARAK